MTYTVEGDLTHHVMREIKDGKGIQSDLKSSAPASTESKALTVQPEPKPKAPSSPKPAAAPSEADIKRRDAASYYEGWNACVENGIHKANQRIKSAASEVIEKFRGMPMSAYARLATLTRYLKATKLAVSFNASQMTDWFIECECKTPSGMEAFLVKAKEKGYTRKIDKDLWETTEKAELALQKVMRKFRSIQRKNERDNISEGRFAHIEIEKSIGLWLEE